METTDKETKDNGVAGSLPSYTPDELGVFQSRSADIRRLFAEAERILAKPLTYSDMNMMVGLFECAGLAVDTLIALLEYCVENGHTNRRYIEKVGLSWAEDGVVTAEDAAERLELYNAGYREILRAFGQGRRDPNKREVGYMRRWLKEEGLTVAECVEACELALERTGRAGFAYADKVLQSKREPFDAPRADKPAANAAKGRNKFANFAERDDTDFEGIRRKAREMLLKRFEEGSDVL